MSKEECKGCSTILRCRALNTKISANGSLQVWAKLPDCPCNSCIVKPICKSTCKDYTIFMDMIEDILDTWKGARANKK